MISTKIISKFSSVLRFSGSYLFQEESVPDHSIEMALLCINFSELVPESNKYELCYRCVIHDLEESITSDIPRPIKHRNPEIKNQIDKAAFIMLVENSTEELAKEVFSAKNKDNVNGYLVHLADRIQCYLKMKREVELYGNKSLQSDFSVFSEDVKELLEEIKRVPVLSTESKERLYSYLKKLLEEEVEEV